MNAWQTAWAQLDMALTGKDLNGVSNAICNNAGKAGAYEWLTSIERAWYLSDGGYSRVCYNEETGKLFVTYQSTDKVKAAWENCVALRQIIEEMIHEVYRQYEKEN